MKQMINNDQGIGLKNIDISGIAKYAANDYGATFATTATIKADLAVLFEDPINGDIAELHNTNATGGGPRLFMYSNGSWYMGSSTTQIV